MPGGIAIDPTRAVGTDAVKRSAGRYILGDLLGRGGMAEVFAGFVMGSHGFQKPVAIKRLLPELANDHVFVERLIGEAKLLVGMSHGNVVSVLDLAREGDDVFLVMEFVDGPSLRGLLKARGERGLSSGLATYVVQSAAAGLQFAHARPGGAVIHADISPSNVLLTTSGEVRVADFGIARREGVGEGIVEGKWAYMAPEQVRGDALTPAADVFALGVVMYELLCGQHPLGRRISGSERESQPLRVVPPRVVRPSVPAGLDAVCMRALAQDPAQRYHSMQELIDAVVDERYANKYREGAAELALAIREVQLGSALPTAVMDRPVTIVTRSLLASGTQPSSPMAGVDGASLMQPLTQVTVDSRPRARAASASVPPLAQGSEAYAPGTLAPAAVVAPVAAAAAKSWWKLAVLGAAAALGVVAAVAIQMQPSGIEPVKTASPSTLSSTSTSTSSLTATATATPIPPIAPPAPVVAAAAVPAPQPQPQPQPQPIEPAQPIEPVQPESQSQSQSQSKLVSAHHAPVVVAKKGTLRVTSDPWAYVTVDDSIKDETPVAKFTLTPGRHTVRLKNGETGATLVRTVTVGAGETALVRVRSEDWQ